MARPGPSLPGAFDLLAGAGPQKLVDLRHRLQTVHEGQPGAPLLHAMVLLRLGREAEARISLDALRADAVAQLVARRWAGMDSAEAPEEPSDVSWGLARLYHLLAEESLCPAPLRDAAYQAALQALGSCGDPRLGELQEEAWACCGRDVLGDSGGCQPLCPGQGPLPPSLPPPPGTRSLPRPIEDWSRGCSLRSTGSLASLASALEISQSPTAAFLSHVRAPQGPSKLCEAPPGSTEPIPEGGQESQEMSWPTSAEITEPPELPSILTPSGDPDCPAAPVECTDTSTAPKALSLPNLEPRESLHPVQDQTAPPASAEDTTSPESNPSPPASSAPETSLPRPPAPSRPSSTSAPPASSCPPCPVSFESEAPEHKFYNFVVLHAMADEDVALRVQKKLEDLGVRDGATFCGDFQVPGRGELHCLQDAIDHSGFIILLMTPNFSGALSLHQVNQALTSSFTHHGRQDSVIPFRPLESPSGCRCPEASDTSRLLSGLVWLDEGSPIFAKKVANTFKVQRLSDRRAHWQREQDVRARLRASQRLDAETQQAEALRVAQAAYQHSLQAWWLQMERLRGDFGSHLSLGSQVPCPPPGPLGVQGPWGAAPSFPGWPPSPQSPAPAPGYMGTPSPGFPQPPAFPPVSSASPQAPLIIHHAQMVQLGMSNHMWNQRGAPAPQESAREGERPSDPS